MIAPADIRLAALGDAADIAAMSRDLIESGLRWAWREGRIVDAIHNPEKNVAVLGRAGEVVGFGIMKYAEQHAHLELLAVRPQDQRRGLGRALVIWLEDAARVAGAERVLVNARWDNVAARNLYAELGYHEVGIDRGGYAAGVDKVNLEKWLRPPA